MYSMVVVTLNVLQCYKCRVHNLTQTLSTDAIETYSEGAVSTLTKTMLPPTKTKWPGVRMHWGLKVHMLRNISV